MKNRKKGIIIGICSVLGILLVALLIFRYWFYSPGIHFFAGSCSVDTQTVCYWYDAETGEFTGEQSDVNLQVTIKRLPWGRLESSQDIPFVEGYEELFPYEGVEETLLGRGWGAFSQPALFDFIDYYVIVVNTKIMVSPTTLRESTEFADGQYNYVFYFAKEHPEYMRVRVITFDYQDVAFGYCGINVEEAKKVQEFYNNELGGAVLRMSSSSE